MGKQRTLGKKKLDGLIDLLYRKHGQGVQINIFDIQKVFDVGRQVSASYDYQLSKEMLLAMDSAIQEVIAELKAKVA